MLSTPMKLSVLLAMVGALLAGAGVDFGVYMITAAVIIPIALVFLGMSK
jgi:predicted RND superfamily exporter protein